MLGKCHNQVFSEVLPLIRFLYYDSHLFSYVFVCEQHDSKEGIIAKVGGLGLVNITDF